MLGACSGIGSVKTSRIAPTECILWRRAYHTLCQAYLLSCDQRKQSVATVGAISSSQPVGDPGYQENFLTLPMHILRSKAATSCGGTGVLKPAAGCGCQMTHQISLALVGSRCNAASSAAGYIQASV